MNRVHQGKVITETNKRSRYLAVSNELVLERTTEAGLEDVLLRGALRARTTNVILRSRASTKGAYLKLHLHLLEQHAQKL